MKIGKTFLIISVALAVLVLSGCAKTMPEGYDNPHVIEEGTSFYDSVMELEFAEPGLKGCWVEVRGYVLRRLDDGVWLTIPKEHSVVWIDGEPAYEFFDHVFCRFHNPALEYDCHLILEFDWVVVNSYYQFPYHPENPWEWRTTLDHCMVVKHEQMPMKLREACKTWHTPEKMSPEIRDAIW